MCVGRPIVGHDTVIAELQTIWEEGGLRATPDSQPDYTPSGYFSVETMNAVLGAYAVNRDVMLVHVFENHMTDTSHTKEEILNMFPNDVHRIFFWFMRGSIPHYKAFVRIVADTPLQDDWYEVDSIDVALGLPPHFMQEEDWKNLRGTFYFIAQGDPWTTANFGYVPRRLRVHLPIDKSTMQVANITPNTFSATVLRRRSTRENWQDLAGNSTNIPAPPAAPAAQQNATTVTVVPIHANKQSPQMDVESMDIDLQDDQQEVHVQLQDSSNGKLQSSTTNVKQQTDTELQPATGTMTSPTPCIIPCVPPRATQYRATPHRALPNVPTAACSSTPAPLPNLAVLPAALHRPGSVRRRPCTCEP